MKKGTIIFIGIIIVCMSAFFVYQSQGGKTNTERQQTEKKQTEPKKEEQKANVHVEKADASIIAKELIANLNEVSLKPGEEKNIDLSLRLYDEGTAKENTINLGAAEKEFLSVKSKEENVAKVKITESGQVNIIASESPSKISIEIEVSYKNKKQNGDLTRKIPITIKDYASDATKGLKGMWQSEKDKTYFYKIVEKGQNIIEVSAMALYETDYTAVVKFTNIQKNVLSGKPEYTFMYPGTHQEPALEFKLEKLGNDKIRITRGDYPIVLTRSSEKVMEEERAKQAMPSSDSNAGVSQTDENNPNDGTKNNTEQSESLKAFFDPVDSNSENQVSVFIQTWGTTESNPKVDKATLHVEQRLNNTLTGMFETQAAKQNETTWIFAWTDDTGTKGIGILVINGEDATIELKSERKSATEGKGIVSYKAQLMKTAQAEF
ncbi:hypothetical protein COD75_04950 [Bacillus anthracis]|uniref:hypothetical protein n=1 Tax=Bacillus tropicus TaxID=2026188 RepID=UPI000BF43A03|nr:hypothetical protein [Bacillus tropicus]PET28398.1 hypothetical protein CN518_24980 [Bacillus anthracis]PGV40302.1 hypothetical protein COD75_04950 [Bacillus anthracis]